MKPMLTVEAASTRLGINKDLVRRLIKQGKLPAARFGTGEKFCHYRIDPDDLEQFIAKSKELVHG